MPEPAHSHREHRARHSFESVALVGLSLAFALPLAAQLAPDLDANLSAIFADREFEAERFGPARWLDEGASYATLEPSATIDKAKDLVRYDTVSGERQVLVAAEALTPTGAEEALTIDDYAFSNDHRLLLVFTNTRKVWRRNTRGDYWALVLESGALHQLGGDAPEASLMFAKLSPDGKAVAYVRANDIYLEDLETGAVRALTSGGSPTRIHGTSDWVYEEELGLRDGFRFSPDGTRIAYWSFDSEGVGIFSLIDDTTSLYPTVQTIPYPKAGTNNSAVRIGVVSTSGGETRWMQVPGDPRDGYIARMDWVDDGTLILQHLNRLQNRNAVLLADAESGEVREMYRDEDEAWLDIVDEHHWLGGGEELLWLSERDGWRHAYRLPRDGGEARLVTRFDGDVVEAVGVDGEERWIYFLASPDDATRLYLYRAPLDGSAAPARITPAGEPGWHTYDLSSDGRWALHTVSTFDRPPRVELVSLPEHRVIRVLASNDDLLEKAAELLAAPVRWLDAAVDDGVVLDGWMITPPDFDPRREEPYPLLVYVYGEPAGQTVVDRWGGRRMLFHRALARQGVVVASFDNRGTPAPKGAAWRKVVYGAVGELSAKEQAAAVRTLLARNTWLDADRVAVWGWSGGGSSTLNALFRYPEVFEVGVSVAPVPDQRLYDTIYQERYMGLPDQNEDGYRRGSPIHHAEGLAGKLLLIHGSGDDNVHYQGTERLVNRLVELGKSFDLMVYPNRSHAISEGDGTSLHVHRLVARYLLDAL